ncbi:MAG: NAD(+)/NADH kinase, partial [Parasporobacterium sp.]|nr:NAD(+)/NADH kinase [Parasporobacterium sp.]
MKKFLLVTNVTKDPDGALTDRARKIIESEGGICTACLFSEKIKGTQYGKLNPASVPEDTELIITLGGDGSFLHAAKDLIDLNIPVMGVNLGNLGYLTEMDLDGFAEEFSHICRNEYHIESRMLLEGSIIREDKEIIRDIAINDIVLNRLGSMSIINFDVLVNGRFLNSYCADGYIISSPTGS